MLSRNKISELHQLIEPISKMETKALVSRREWGTIDFAMGEQNIESILSICRFLNDLPLEYLTESSANEIIGSLNEVRRVLSLIDGFRLESGGDPAARVEAINQELRAHEGGLTERTRSWIPFLAYQKGDVQENIARLQDSKVAATNMVTDLQTFADQSRENFEAILRATREASASAGVGVFTEDFRRQAEEAKASSNKWLIAAFVLSSITLLAALIFYFLPLPEGTNEKLLIYSVINKVVIFLVLISAAYWTGQIYRATRHQQIMNEHRANALRTFQAFVQATSDETTRNAVLIETTRSIFAIAPSGFISSQDSAPDGMKVLEIFKGAGGK